MRIFCFALMIQKKQMNNEFFAANDIVNTESSLSSDTIAGIVHPGLVNGAIEGGRQALQSRNAVSQVSWILL